VHQLIDKSDEEKVLSFEPATHQPELYNAWNTFIKTGKINNQIVPVHIGESWKRSKSAKVNPFDPPGATLLSETEHRELKARNSDLIDIAHPIAESIHNSLEQTRYLVVLYDAKGYHLFRMGKRSDLMRSIQLNIKEGVCFEESNVGTCGFSLVKKYLKPIQIVGCEHYAAWLHYVTGAYAPIISPRERNLVGVIGVSGAKTLPNHHTLGIVIAASKAIGKMLEIEQARNNLAIYSKALQMTLDSFDDGVFYVDSQGRVLDINLTAKRIFNLKGRNITKPHISQLRQLASIKPMIMRELASTQPVKREVECQINNQMYIVELKNDRLSNGREGGLVVQLKNLKKLSRIVQNHTSERPTYSFDSIIGSSKIITEAKKLAMIAAESDSTVIIEGESGTGKEVVAQAIHNASKRKNKPFIVLNCAAIPTELFETTMFGHERGAFTGAIKTQIGKFELADSGTLFLDEIGDMPLMMQAKILRAIEYNTIEKVGGKKSIPVDVRILAATNKDLYGLVKNKEFREDLYYRLNVFRIVSPPLRERGDDVIELTHHFVEQFAPSFQKHISRVSDSSIDLLLSHAWPGNIRELKNAINFAIARVDAGTLLPQHFKGFFREIREERPGPIYSEVGEKLNEIEKNAILKALRASNGNKAKTAKMLGIGRATLYRKLKTISEYNNH
jgi:sigma-54 dependent transcriptional regulator, acetoin dehydrogenase operon transcriptional activator AcoR